MVLNINLICHTGEAICAMMSESMTKSFLLNDYWRYLSNIYTITALKYCLQNPQYLVLSPAGLYYSFSPPKIFSISTPFPIPYNEQFIFSKASSFE